MRTARRHAKRWRRRAAQTAPSRLRSWFELKSLPEQPLDCCALGIGRSPKRDESRVLSTALKQAAPIVELAASVEEECRVARERPDTDDVNTVDGVPDDLPHRTRRTGWLAAIGDLVSFRGDLFDGSDGSLDRRPHLGRNLLE